MHKLVVVVFVFVQLNGLCADLPLSEGEDCENENGERGVCKLIEKCPAGLQQVYRHHRHNLKVCGYANRDQIVCCPSETSTEVITKSRDKMRRTAKACIEFDSRTTVSIGFHILNGENANRGEFPHMAALAFHHAADGVYKFDCGGTLISDSYVLTAAHCLVNIDLNNLTFVRLGEVDIPSNVTGMSDGVDFGVGRVFIKEYDRRTKKNDIALVRLNKTVDFGDNIRPACLYTRSDNPKSLIITGWGVTEFAGQSDVTKASRLQKAMIEPVQTDKCNDLIKGRVSVSIDHSQMCAFGNQSDACQGDSGGPIQITTNSKLYQVVGITSFGLGCGSYPGVYTRVYSYLNWIEDIVWPK